MRVASSIARGVLNYWPVVAILVAWELWVVLNGYTAIVAPPPTDVLADIASHPDAYVPDALFTIGMATAGLASGLILGLVAAVAVWSSAAISGVVTPAALVVRAVPITAMIPIITRVIGYDDRTVLAITSIISFFPVFVLAVSGLSSVPAVSEDLFQVFGAKRLVRLWRLHLPAAMPNIAIALRITAPAAILASMLAEFLIGQHGLGHLFSDARSYMDMNRAWGTAVVATVLSVVSFLIARAVERAILSRFT